MTQVPLAESEADMPFPMQPLTWVNAFGGEIVFYTITSDDAWEATSRPVRSDSFGLLRKLIWSPRLFISRSGYRSMPPGVPRSRRYASLAPTNRRCSLCEP